MTTEPQGPGRPSPTIALLLSLLCATGVAHAYAGRPRRGLAWVGVLFGAMLVMIIAARVVHGGPFVAIFAIVALVASATWIPATIDAYRIASTSPRRGSFVQVALIWVGVQVAAVFVAMFARMFVVEAFRLPSASMTPTLIVGDHVFVAKSGWSPRRGDVVVFPFPERPEQDFLKRVVALPGDRLEVNDGHMTLNGTPVPSCRVGEYAYDEPEAPVPHHEGDLFVEVLDGHPFLALYDHSAGTFPETQGPWTVKPGEVFVVGDNRHNSHDSRMWNGGQGGGAPIETVRGDARVVWLSVNERGIDWTRMGAPIDSLHVPHARELDAPIAACLTTLHVR
jgi:signal peptidase I